VRNIIFYNCKTFFILFEPQSRQTNKSGSNNK
jgi:hypothetical protein